MTRDEHIEWCKARARKYLDAGDVVNAIASMMADVTQHPETTEVLNPTLTLFGMMAAQNNDVGAARRFVEGFR
jgi:hypothetical protein